MPKASKSGQSIAWTASATIVYLNERICRPAPILSEQCLIYQNMTLMKNKNPTFHKLGLLGLSYGLLLTFLFTTDPSKLALVWLLVPFVLLFISLFGTIFYSLLFFPKTKQLSFRKRTLLATAGAILPVLLLILKSINQLTVRDSLILSVFILSTALYISRTDFINR